MVPEPHGARAIARPTIGISELDGYESSSTRIQQKDQLFSGLGEDLSDSTDSPILLKRMLAVKTKPRSFQSSDRPNDSDVKCPLL